MRAAASQHHRNREIVVDIPTQPFFLFVLFLHVYVYWQLSGGMRGVCAALKMGLFLHAVGSVPPTESTAERVRLSSEKQRLSLAHRTAS